MKLMTINAHSLPTDGYVEKLNTFASVIAKLQPDIITMQEVYQDAASPVIYQLTEEVRTAGNIPIKNTNHALNVINILNSNGIYYNMTWLGIKQGYGKYDEGAAILSRRSPDSIHSFLVSRTDDYASWKTRKALGIKISGEWFYSIHTSRWDDTDEPFSEQWRKICNNISTGTQTWLMGDFNCPSHFENEGYSLIIKSGWYDTYAMANKKDDGFTVQGNIDGWHDKKNITKSRIDYIFTNKPTKINNSRLIFNGVNEPIISDHYGIIIDVQKG